MEDSADYTVQTEEAITSIHSFQCRRWKIAKGPKAGTKSNPLDVKIKILKIKYFEPVRNVFKLASRRLLSKLEED